MEENGSFVIKNGLDALAKFQEKLDSVTWQISKPEIAKLRHITFNEGKWCISGDM